MTGESALPSVSVIAGRSLSARTCIRIGGASSAGETVPLLGGVGPRPSGMIVIR